MVSPVRASSWDVNNLGEGYEQVYSFPWSTVANPFQFAGEGTTLRELVHQLVTKPEDVILVYQRVKDRGISQVVFRNALMIAYRQQCAFCGLSLKPALQAAHIIPWGEASPEQRVSVSNGLLLCSTHHDLFDADILSLDPPKHTYEMMRLRWSEALSRPWDPAPIR